MQPIQQADQRSCREWQVTTAFEKIGDCEDRKFALAARQLRHKLAELLEIDGRKIHFFQRVVFRKGEKPADARMFAEELIVGIRGQEIRWTSKP